MLEIDSVEEILKCSLLDLHDDLAVAVARLGYPERAAVEAFIEETKSGTIEEKNLRRFTPFAEEDEERAAARVAAHSLGHDPRQPIKTHRRSIGSIPTKISTPAGID